MAKNEQSIKNTFYAENVKMNSYEQSWFNTVYCSSYYQQHHVNNDSAEYELGYFCSEITMLSRIVKSSYCVNDFVDKNMFINIHIASHFVLYFSVDLLMFCSFYITKLKVMKQTAQASKKNKTRKNV